MADYQRNPEWWALIAAIRRNPADDLPRLVAADWLDEEGRDPARANFIRTQVELARLPDKERQGARGFDLRVRQYSSRDDCRERLLLHPHLWTQVAIGYDSIWYALDPASYLRACLRRGFISEVFTNACDWWGEACSGCGGSGRITLSVTHSHRSQGNRSSFPIECSQCHGLGRVGGFGRMICATQPVDTLGVTDMQPYHSGGQTASFTWESDLASGGSSPMTVPECVFRLLNGGVIQEEIADVDGEHPLIHRSREYGTLNSAMSDLSQAGLAWASG